MPKQSTPKPSFSSSPSNQVVHRLTEGVFILALALASFFVIALLTYNGADPSWSNQVSHSKIINAGGVVGAWFADVFLYLFGFFAYAFPLGIIYAASKLLRGKKNHEFDPPLFLLRLAGFVVFVAAGSALLSIELTRQYFNLPYTAGGILGQWFGSSLVQLFNLAGATILLLALALVGITLMTKISWLGLATHSVRFIVWLAALSHAFIGKLWQQVSRLTALLRQALSQGVGLLAKLKTQLAKKPRPTVNAPISVQPKEPVSKPIIVKPSNDSAEQPPSKKVKKILKKTTAVASEKPSTSHDKPGLALLEPALASKKQGYSEARLEEMSREVEQRLQDFGVEVQVVAVLPGPVVTRFELQLAPGIKVSKISGLGKDLARSLSVLSVRVVEVIPGKPVVGLEVPNDDRAMVRLSEVLASDEYEKASSPLSLALGKDIAGEPVIVDLAKMPHLLVAGTTGSGKSVGLNAMLLSLLFKAEPEEVRMILVDPKMLELAIYDDIPHLLTPVVTDMKEAASALRWCVAEMERRYRLMASLGVRNLAGFNQKVKSAIQKGEPLVCPISPKIDGQEPELLSTLPYIVVVIDEFADMMMVVGKKVEQLIARIAQKARAAGIHLILATQRPSVDVITGLIKSNIPTRIAFQVSSRIDSRTILDQQGAEQLLGHGDMLYLAPGTGTPVRVHGAYVADSEVHKVANEWKSRGDPDYLEAITHNYDEEPGGEFSQEGSEEGASSDPLYDQAVHFVTESRRASISSVQRRFKVGYNRAARLIEEMERSGVVSPMESNGSREVLAPPPPKDD